MGGFMLIIWGLVYVAILIAVIYFVYTWVTTFIALKREHNDLLREILKKMDKAGN
jgi:protein-S-isoprenylcysteine O-methyltransferase Ste14